MTRRRKKTPMNDKTSKPENAAKTAEVENKKSPEPEVNTDTGKDSAEPETKVDAEAQTQTDAENKDPVAEEQGANKEEVKEDSSATATTEGDKGPAPEEEQKESSEGNSDAKDGESEDEPSGDEAPGEEESQDADSADEEPAPVEHVRVLKLRTGLAAYQSKMSQLVISNPKDLVVAAKSLSALVMMPIMTTDAELRDLLIEELIRFFKAEKDGVVREDKICRGFDSLDVDVSKRVSMVIHVLRANTTGRGDNPINEATFVDAFKDVRGAEAASFLQYFERRRKGK